MPGVEQIATWRNDLIRKALFGSVFAAEEDAPLITSADLFDPVTGEIQPLPPEYGDVGYITTDGVTMPRETESSDTNSWQSTEPTRSDETTDTSSISFVMQETNPHAVALYEGILVSDLGDVGEPWEFDKPANPLGLHRRLLVVSQDTHQGEPIYIVKFYPRTKITSREDEAHNRENVIERGVTATAYRDPVLGTSVRTMIDGPGWRLLAGS